MREFEPYPYQAIMIWFALRVMRCALWAGMGMGKTSSVLAVIDALFLSGLVNKVIVFAPLRVARDTWPNEVRKWKQFAGMRIAFLEWTPAEREFLRARSDYLKLLKRDELCKEPATQAAKALALARRPAAIAARLKVLETVDVQCMNYDLVQQLTAIFSDEWPWDMVVADESTRLKGLRIKQGAKRANKLSKIAFSHVGRWINLTGTPSPNGLVDLWGQTWFLDAGHRLGKSFDAFQNRWFGYQRAKDAVNAHKTFVQRVVFPHAQAEIEGLLKDICLSMNPKDWFDLNEPIVRTIEVELPAKARVHYREMEREMFTMLEGHEVEAFAAAAKTMKCLQLANGAAYVGGSNAEWVVVHDEKLDALESIIEEAAGMPVLVAYHFKSDLARLKKRFPDGLDLSTKEGMRRAMAGEGRVWFGHPAGMGHGVDGLQYHCNIIAFFSMSWNLEERLQVVERVGPMRQKQAGFERACFIYNIVARGTIDETVLKRIDTKRSVQDLLLEAMKGTEHEYEIQ
jgi:hypothetical protein